MTNSADNMPQRNALDNMTPAERQELEQMIREGIAAFREQYARWKTEKQASQHEHMPRQT
jgi:hypothetical protein